VFLGSADSWHALKPSPEAHAAFVEAAADFARLPGPLAEGARHLAAGAPDKAVEALARADAEDADAHFFAGVAHYLKRRPDPAEAAFTRAIACRPHAAVFRAWRAPARLELGRADAARDDVRAGLKLAPDHPDLLLLSGEYDAVLRARPEDACALALRARRRIAAGRPGEATADLEQASRRRTDGIEAIQALRSRAALATGGDAVAESAAADAVRLGPDYAPAHLALAAARWKRGQPGPAREALDRALALDGGDADAHELDGEMRFAEGAKLKAVAAWERAAALDPSRKARLAPLIAKARE
jgi:predicted Zn-dependent protease